MTLHQVTQNVRGKIEAHGYTTITEDTIAAWLNEKHHLAYVIATEITNKKTRKQLQELNIK